MDSPWRKVFATLDYEATEDVELSFKKGDTIVVKNERKCGAGSGTPFAGSRLQSVSTILKKGGKKKKKKKKKKTKQNKSKKQSLSI